MIRKIVSNGRTGVARGALDAALALDIPHGGWALSGVPGAQPLPGRYHLQEMKTGSLSRCVERNVKESDGTLVLTFSDHWPDDALCARKSAARIHMPWLHINLGKTAEFEAAQSIHEWLKESRIETLHMVGAISGAAGKPVDRITADLLEAVYYLGLIEGNMKRGVGTASPDREIPPNSMDEMIARISAGMTLKDRVLVANLQESQLELLKPTLGRYILVQFERWQESRMEGFSPTELGEGISDVEGAASAAINGLWSELRKTHRLRLVK
jgi:hypothetical protein